MVVIFLGLIIFVYSFIFFVNIGLDFFKNFFYWWCFYLWNYWILYNLFYEIIRYEFYYFLDYVWYLSYNLEVGMYFFLDV